MTSKHTPGPWRVFMTPDGNRVAGIGEAGGEGVADAGFGLWRDGPEAEANARLIAAAPETHEEAAWIVERFFRLGAITLDDGETKQRMLRLRAAIAKAEGGEA